MLSQLRSPVARLLDKFITDKDQAAKLAHEIATMADKTGNAIVIYIALKDTPPAFISSSLIAYNLYLHRVRQQ